MKKIVVLILFTVISGLAFSQENSGYDVFLLLDSDKGEMAVDSIIVDDKLRVKTFTISKDVPQEKEKYILKVDENGEIQKYLGGKGQQDCCNFVLKYVEARNIKENFLKIKTSNSINYKDILNTKFVNILKILREAKKIFIIDLKVDRNDGVYYTAFEVCF